MKKQLVGLTVAKLAKEKGFDELCIDFVGIDLEEDSLMHYIGDTIEEKHEVAKDFIEYYRPTQSLLQDWLREVHNIDVLIDSVGSKNGYYYCLQSVETGDKIKNWGDYYHTFKNCLETALEEALTLIK